MPGFGVRGYLTFACSLPLKVFVLSLCRVGKRPQASNLPMMFSHMLGTDLSEEGLEVPSEQPPWGLEVTDVPQQAVESVLKDLRKLLSTEKAKSC